MFEGDGGWSNKPPPMEYEAGPNNPWAKCSPKGRGSGSKPGKSFIDFDPPKPPSDETSTDGGVVVDGFLWEVGTALQAGAAKMAAVLGTAVSSQSENDDRKDGGIHPLLIIAIIAPGSVAAGAMSTAFDPPVPDYAKRVVPPAVRRVEFPAGTSDAIRDMVTAFGRLEQAAMGEIEVVDRARAAGQAGDGKAYHDQVGDLFMVQTLKNDQIRAAAAAMRAVIDESKDALAASRVPAGMSMRDMVAPLYAMRPALERVGISASDLNQALYHFRVPSASLDACEKYVQAAISRTSGDALAMAKSLADELEGMDFVDLAPFDVPPKT